MIFGSVKVTSKEQIAIPVDIRKAAKIKRGDVLLLNYDGSEICMLPAKNICWKSSKRDMLLLSEAALRKTWDNPEDEAWSKELLRMARRKRSK